MGSSASSLLFAASSSRGICPAALCVLLVRPPRTHAALRPGRGPNLGECTAVCSGFGGKLSVFGTIISTKNHRDHRGIGSPSLACGR